MAEEGEKETAPVTPTTVEETEPEQEKIDAAQLRPVPEGPRMVGKCKWFNVLKGFGFITTDDAEGDFFVHQSELLMSGFRSLDEGEMVSFYTRQGKRGLEAYYVSAATNGEELKGSKIRPIGKKKSNLIRCFKCGSYGNHVASKCRKVTGEEKQCYECHATDHIVSSCPLRNVTTA